MQYLNSVQFIVQVLLQDVNAGKSTHYFTLAQGLCTNSEIVWDQRTVLAYWQLVFGDIISPIVLLGVPC